MTTSSPPARTALVLVDIQDGFLESKHWGPSRSNPHFEENAKAILTAYRSLVASSTSSTNIPHKLIHVAHASLDINSALHPAKPGFAYQAFAKPNNDELIIVKNVNSAFIGTDLEQILRTHFGTVEGGSGSGSGKLYICGLTTDHCVSTTTRMAGNLKVTGKAGEVFFVEDSTACWKKSEDSPFDAETVHAVHVESLQEFATIVKTQDVIAYWKGLEEDR